MINKASQQQKNVFFDNEFKTLLEKIRWPLIKTKKQKITPVGSFSKTDTHFFSDIDIMHDIDSNSLLELKRSFQGFIRNTSSIDLCFIEAKLGSDEELRIIDSDNIRLKHLREENKKKNVETIKEKYSQGLISEAEKNKFIKVAEGNSLKEKEDWLRPNILRWSVDEILKGEKELDRPTKNSKIMKLEDAFQQKNLFKIDFITNFRNRLIELNIVYILKIKRKRIGQIIINTKRSLYDEFNKHIYNKDYYKAFKRYMLLLDGVKNKDIFINDKRHIKISILAEAYAIIKAVKSAVENHCGDTVLHEESLKSTIKELEIRLSNINFKSIYNIRKQSIKSLKDLLGLEQDILNTLNRLCQAYFMKPILEKDRDDGKYKIVYNDIKNGELIQKKIDIPSTMKEAKKWMIVGKGTFDTSDEDIITRKELAEYVIRNNAHNKRKISPSKLFLKFLEDNNFAIFL